MSDIGYLAALLGGVLALLSPCSALLLPGFFAYAFGSRRRLVARTGVFYLGLAAVMVPLGVGSSAVAGVFFTHRDTLILVAGWTIIGLGVVQLAGRGFAFGPAQRWSARLTGESATSVFALGAVYGLAGFCSGPILGAILTLSATSAGPAAGGALLAVYALGMTVPLLVLALFWDRWQIGRRRWLRGRTVTLGRLRLHTTSMVSGLLFVGLGVLFLVFDGTAGLAGGLGLTDVEGAAQEWVGRTAGAVPDEVALLAVAAVALALLLRRRRRGRDGTAAPDEQEGGGRPDAALPSRTDTPGGISDPEGERPCARST